VRGKGPTAVASKLGYLLSGPLQSTKADKEAHMMNIITSLPDTLSFDMEKLETRVYMDKSRANRDRREVLP